MKSEDPERLSFLQSDLTEGMLAAFPLTATEWAIAHQNMGTVVP
jgi:hypothetical protein